MDSESLTIINNYKLTIDFFHPQTSHNCSAIQFLILCVYIYLAFDHNRNHALISLKDDYSKGLIIPSYAQYFMLLLLSHLVSFLLNLIVELNFKDRTYTIDNVFVAFQVGYFHVLHEALAIFYTRYGAGLASINYSIKTALFWGLISGGFFYVFNFKYNNISKQRMALIYYIFITFIYSSYNFIPIQILYRRPAFRNYSIFNSLFNLIILLSVLLYDLNGTFNRILFFICLLFVAVLQPLIIFQTMQQDSQYWQGYGDSPLRFAWDEVNTTTAIAMANYISDVEASDREQRSPILHFGLISLDKKLGYIAGGASRVYFGKVGKAKVALKMIYAIELTPNDVTKFCKEAKILHMLKHENIVECRGVCVIPPVLTIVLEFCIFGSLYDFLYNPPDNVVKADTDRSSWAIKKGLFFFNITNDFKATATNRLPIKKVVDIETIAERTESKESDLGSLSSDFGRPSVPMVSMVKNPILLDEKSIAAVSAAHTPPPASGRSSFFDKGRKLSTNSSTHKTSSNKDRNSFFNAVDIDMLYPSNNASKRALQNNDLRTQTYDEQCYFRIKMMCDVVRAVEHVHSKGFLHCDIKSLNFLVTENYVVKLSDFGESRPIACGDESREQCGEQSPGKINAATRKWAAPEIFSSTGCDVYSKHSDVFAAAVVLSELITLQLPYTDENYDSLSDEQWLELLVVQNVRPSIAAGEANDTICPAPLQEAIRSCWSSLPDQRPSASFLLSILTTHFSCMESRDRIDSFGSASLGSMP